MPETEATVDTTNVVDDPLFAGGMVGVALGVLERFFLHVELTTLAVSFVVGIVRSRSGTRSSVDVGQALTTVGVVGMLVFETLVLVFG